MLPAYSLDAKGHQGIVAACTRNSENMVAWCAQFSDVVNGGLVVLSAIDKCGEKVGEGQREGGRKQEAPFKELCLTPNKPGIGCGSRLCICFCIGSTSVSCGPSLRACTTRR